MGADTKIQWCTHSWSPWRGCTHGILPDGAEHPGCQHCYAETMSRRNSATLGIWGPDGTRVMAADKSWQQVRRWNAEAAASGEFCGIFPSLCDPFEDWAGPISSHRGWFLHRSTDGWCVSLDLDDAKAVRLGDVRDELFRLIDGTPALTWQLLTKRPQNIQRMWPSLGGLALRDWTLISPGQPGYRNEMRYRKNVQLITSVSDQATADALIPELLKCRDLCPVLGLSCEPLLGPINIPRVGQLDWIIVGGESGPGARPCVAEWIWDIVLQCNAVNVPCFVKQLGSFVVTTNINTLDWSSEIELDEWGSYAASCRLLLCDSKGGDPEEWPEDLRVRQMPEVRS